MGNDLVIAKRYSTALNSCLKGVKEVDLTLSELTDFEELLSQSEELRFVLSNPFQSSTEKLNVIGAVAKKMKLTKHTGNFLKVLARNDRLGLLAEIKREFIRETDERLGRGKAKVYSAAEFSDSEQKKLQKSIEKMIGKKLELSYELDADLLGGFLIETENKIFDYSVKGQLERLEDLVSKMRVW